MGKKNQEGIPAEKYAGTSTRGETAEHGKGKGSSAKMGQCILDQADGLSMELLKRRRIRK